MVPWYSLISTLWGKLRWTETLFPNKPENTRLRKGPNPLHYQLLGRALVLITIREYHCTGPPSFYTLAVLISLIIRVLLIIPQAILMHTSIVRNLKKVKKEIFTWEDSIQGPTGCNANDTTISATPSGFHNTILATNLFVLRQTDSMFY